MGRIIRGIGRAFLLLIVWAFAFIAAGQAFAQYMEHRQLSERVIELGGQYDVKVNDYAEILAEEEKIKNDPEYQKLYLKEHYGYAEPDETPIVIISE